MLEPSGRFRWVAGWLTFLREGKTLKVFVKNERQTAKEQVVRWAPHGRGLAALDFSHSYNQVKSLPGSQ